jgi:hypothetical protein
MRDPEQLDIEDYLALLDGYEPWADQSDEAPEGLGADLLDDEDFPDFVPWDFSPEANETARRAQADWLAAR